MSTPRRQRIFVGHDGARIVCGLGTVRLAHEMRIGSDLLPIGRTVDFLEGDAATRTARCWFGSGGATISLDDLEPVVSDGPTR